MTYAVFIFFICYLVTASPPGFRPQLNGKPPGLASEIRTMLLDLYRPLSGKQEVGFIQVHTSCPNSAGPSEPFNCREADIRYSIQYPVLVQHVIDYSFPSDSESTEKNSKTGSKVINYHQNVRSAINPLDISTIKNIEIKVIKRYSKIYIRYLKTRILTF